MKVPSIAPDLCMENDGDVTVNVIIKENLDFLYRLAVKYAQLLNVEPPCHPTGRAFIRERMCLLYNALGSVVPHHVNLGLVDDRFQLCIYHLHKWPNCTLLLIPMDFTERLKGKAKKITLGFIRRFIKYHRMMDITDIPYFKTSGVCIDYVDFEQLDREEKKDLYREEKPFRSYKKGRIHRKLCRICSRAFCRNLEVHIRNCNPSNNEEKRPLELITEGMSLTAKNSPHILSYDYDYVNEKERDFEPPSLEYQILLTYSIMDMVTKDTESCFGTDCQETYNQAPVSFTFVAPGTEKLFRLENHPERFSKWFERFVEHITCSS